MKKEVILAIGIGFALGLVITFGIWSANKSLKGLPGRPTPTPQTVEATPTTTTDDSAAVSLAFTSPADEALVATPKVTVSGKTIAGATVVVIDEDNQQIMAADDKGEFSAHVSLIAGYNTLRVTVYDKSGNSTTQSIIVTYSTAKI